MGITGTYTPPYTITIPATFGSPALQSGYSAYSVTYNIAHEYLLSSTQSSNGSWGSTGSGSATISTPAGVVHSVGSGGATLATNGVPVTSSWTTSSFVATQNFMTANCTPANSAGGHAALKINQAGSSAVVKQRIANTNPTTIANTFVLSSYYSNVSGTSALATGTVNYMAIY